MSSGELVEGSCGPHTPRSIILRRAGVQGPQGVQGVQGGPGFNGWSPSVVLVADGERRVWQRADWLGGEGPKPPVGQYLGDETLVDDIADALDVRGPSGDGSGDMIAATYDPQGKIADAFARANHTGTQPLSTISDAGSMAAEDVADYTNTAGMNAALAALETDIEGQITTAVAGLQTQINSNGSAIEDANDEIDVLQTQIAKRVAVDGAQSFTATEKKQGRANLSVRRELIAYQAISAIGSVTFTNISEFRDIFVHFCVEISANATLNWRGSLDNGSTWVSSGYNTIQHSSSAGATTVSSATATDTAGVLVAGGALGSAGATVGISVDFFDFNSSKRTWWNSRSGYNSTSSAITKSDIYGVVAGAMNAIQFFPGSGATMTGYIMIEGARDQ